MLRNLLIGKEDGMTSTHDTGMTDQLDRQMPDMGWKGLALLGVVMLTGGLLAFLNPFAASLAAEAVAGAAFLIAGAMQLGFAVRDGTGTRGDRWLSGALGTVLILFAVSLVLSPLAGLVTLTALVALFFTVMGALRVALAWHMRPARGWGWLMAGGAMSLVLAALIVLSLPGGALGLLGLFLGIDLTVGGAVTLGLAWHRKSQG
ncbi:HdeD family acid-resistance protein [Roseovarius ramblicola]|uniref:HdeD family acid-resistance protein n=1 Tax=Roseovarius ramblicola TaxID=2022336 RepID=A0ABV5HZN2_9RHOB